MHAGVAEAVPLRILQCPKQHADRQAAGDVLRRSADLQPERLLLVSTREPFVSCNFHHICCFAVGLTAVKTALLTKVRPLEYGMFIPALKVQMLGLDDGCCGLLSCSHLQV